jgi:hypothetical protein
MTHTQRQGGLVALLDLPDTFNAVYTAHGARWIKQSFVST